MKEENSYLYYLWTGNAWHEWEKWSRLHEIATQHNQNHRSFFSDVRRWGILFIFLCRFFASSSMLLMMNYYLLKVPISLRIFVTKKNSQYSLFRHASMTFGDRHSPPLVSLDGFFFQILILIFISPSHTIQTDETANEYWLIDVHPSLLIYYFTRHSRDSRRFRC